MRTIFVTGGAGFIGSAFVRLLLEQTDCTIVNFDLLTYAGTLENLEGVDKKRHHFIHGDIADANAVAAALERGTDAIVNFAAESHVDRSIASADDFLRTNVTGTQTLLDAARQAGVRRFVQVSTDEVMGSLPEDDAEFFTEDSPFAPNSPYAASKAAADHLVRAYFHTYGLPTVTTNCSNNYGPYQHPEKLIPVIILNVMARKPVPIYGDGMNVRDWLYVRDHVDALWLVLTRGRVGETYTIGGHNERSNLQLAQKICEMIDALGLGGRGDSKKLIELVADRPGHDRRYAIDSGKIETALGWKPGHAFEPALIETISWYEKNQHWVGQGRRAEPPAG